MAYIPIIPDMPVMVVYLIDLLPTHNMKRVLAVRNS